jgi:hypothetical protein
VHPVQGCLGVGVEDRAGTGGQREEVALLPLDHAAIHGREAAPENDVIQLGGGIGAGVDPLAGTDANKVGQ